MLPPVEIDPATTCDLDGMLLADYAGPKAQIHYAGTPQPVFCCDANEMLRFSEVRVDMADLTGGTTQDTKM